MRTKEQVIRFVENELNSGCSIMVNFYTNGAETYMPFNEDHAKKFIEELEILDFKGIVSDKETVIDFDKITEFSLDMEIYKFGEGSKEEILIAVY